MLTTLIEKDYRAVAAEILNERRVALLPPYRYSVLVRCESKDREYSQAFLQQAAARFLQQAGSVAEIWGPIPAPMERKAGRYRAHMVILAQDRARLHFFYVLGGPIPYSNRAGINYGFRLMSIRKNLADGLMFMAENARVKPSLSPQRIQSFLCHCCYKSRFFSVPHYS